MKTRLQNLIDLLEEVESDKTFSWSVETTDKKTTFDIEWIPLVSSPWRYKLAEGDEWIETLSKDLVSALEANEVNLESFMKQLEETLFYQTAKALSLVQKIKSIYS